MEEKSVPYDIVLSNKWKSFLQIKGTIRDEQKRNAKLYVKETFNTKFTGYLHGIYIDLPAYYEMQWEDGSIHLKEGL